MISKLIFIHKARKLLLRTQFPDFVQKLLNTGLNFQIKQIDGVFWMVIMFLPIINWALHLPTRF